jgi:hypothetical protein
MRALKGSSRVLIMARNMMKLKVIME